MFRQAKSAFIWFHLYKFRKTFTIIFLLLSIVLFSQWIYSDIVQYLELREKLEYLDFILPLKWAVIFFNIALSLYLFLRLFKSEKIEEVKETKSEKKQETPKKDKLEEEFTSREKEFLYKKKLNNNADNIIQK